MIKLLLLFSKLCTINFFWKAFNSLNYVSDASMKDVVVNAFCSSITQLNSVLWSSRVLRCPRQLDLHFYSITSDRNRYKCWWVFCTDAWKKFNQSFNKFCFDMTSLNTNIMNILKQNLLNIWLNFFHASMFTLSLCKTVNLLRFK